jgi:acyl-CoA thioesterase I
VAFSSAMASNAPVRWLILGDSLSAAYGIDTDSGWVTLLQQQLREHGQAVEVVNASLSGETTSGGLQRLPRLLTQHQPEAVVLALGANDALRGQDLRATTRHLRRMVELAQAQGSQVILLGIRLPPNYGPAWDRRLGELYQQIASDYSLPFDPFFLAEVALDPNLMQEDGLHPNKAAQPLILQRVWPLLQPLLPPSVSGDGRQKTGAASHHSQPPISHYRPGSDG